MRRWPSSFLYHSESWRFYFAKLDGERPCSRAAGRRFRYVLTAAGGNKSFCNMILARPYDIQHVGQTAATDLLLTHVGGAVALVVIGKCGG